jgi:hypothetical protein
VESGRVIELSRRPGDGLGPGSRRAAALDGDVVEDAVDAVAGHAGDEPSADAETSFGQRYRGTTSTHGPSLADDGVDAWGLDVAVGVARRRSVQVRRPGASTGL